MLRVGICVSDWIKTKLVLLVENGLNICITATSFGFLMGKLLMRWRLAMFDLNRKWRQCVLIISFCPRPVVWILISASNPQALHTWILKVLRDEKNVHKYSYKYLQLLPQPFGLLLFAVLWIVSKNASSVLHSFSLNFLLPITFEKAHAVKYSKVIPKKYQDAEIWSKSYKTMSVLEI